MEEFSVFFKLGFNHITDLGGYDHILFVVALCAIYTLSDWRKILGVVTCFTIGHSITLALSVLNIVTINSKLIEFLIPITILITAISNIWFELNSSKNNYPRYIITVFFGLIHGMGFSNYLKALIGSNTNIVKQLLAFNLGLEIGQIVIVLLFLVVNYLLISKLNVKKRDINYLVSSFVAVASVYLIIKNWII